MPSNKTFEFGGTVEPEMLVISGGRTGKGKNVEMRERRKCITEREIENQKQRSCIDEQEKNKMEVKTESCVCSSLSNRLS